MAGFRKRPSYAVYVDYGVDGRYRPRIIRRDDPGIDKGKPLPIWMLPIASKFENYSSAVDRICEKLDRMGLEDYLQAHVFHRDRRDGRRGQPEGKQGPASLCSAAWSRTCSVDEVCSAAL